MEVEIIEFYPQKDTKEGLKCGTLHVYIADLGLDIRGIRFIKAKKEWIMQMPHKRAIDGGKVVFYPIISFTDIEKMKELLMKIKEKGVSYIKQTYTFYSGKILVIE